MQNERLSALMTNRLNVKCIYTKKDNTVRRRHVSEHDNQLNEMSLDGSVLGGGVGVATALDHAPSDGHRKLGGVFNRGRASRVGAGSVLAVQ
jgi:hypothetical protein